MMAAMRTVSVPPGVTRTSGEPTGGGVRLRGVKMAVQTAATGSGSSGSGQVPVMLTASYGQPSARACVIPATSGGPCRTRPPGRKSRVARTTRHASDDSTPGSSLTAAISAGSRAAGVGRRGGVVFGERSIRANSGPPVVTQQV